MEHKQIFCGSVPPLSPKHFWCVAQNSEAEEDDETQVHIFYNLNDPMSYYRCQIPELRGKTIRGCFHGCWAVLSSNHPRDAMWTLWNPFTSQIIILPPLIRNGSTEDSYNIRHCCLSSPPDHPNSFLLLARTNKPNIVYCWIGSDSYFRNARKRIKLSWTEKTFAKQLRSITGSHGSFYNLTCCNSKVYACFADATRHNSLLVVEFDILVSDRKYKKLKEVVITLLPVLEFRCPRIVDSTRVSLLKGSCSELFMVVLGLKGPKWTSTSVSGVYAFKLDMDNKRWEELEDLKDTMLSVEYATGSPVLYSPAIASSELGGYIRILADGGKFIYSYNVKDKSISLSSIPCLAGTNHVSAWAMLECTRQEREGDTEDGILVRSVKGNQQVESHLVSFPFPGLNMECSVKLVANNNRLKSEKADSKQEGDKDFSIIVKPDEGESHLLNLPLHVLGAVMEFSVGVEYLKFRSTCKSCHLAAPLLPCNGKASKRLQKYSLTTPWLIAFDKHKGIITFTDPMCGDKYFIKTPQELICDFEIKGSRYGWLLILNYSGSLVFYNPFTSDIRELPQLPGSDIFSFSAPPTSPDCMVAGIAIDQYLYHYHVCIHFVGGEPSWRKIRLDINGDDLFSSLTLFGRDLYALRDDRGLDVFEEMGREDQYRWKPNVAKAPTSCCTSLAQSFLLRCDQHLLHVIVEKFGESVEVFKLNDSTQEWVKIDSLGKHMIFICGMSSVCMDAKTPHMENKIYFPRLPAQNENMNDMLFYSLETGRYHTSSNNNFQESFRDFSGTSHLLVPHAWIEPTWS